jgi:outer membrane protein
MVRGRGFFLPLSRMKVITLAACFAAAASTAAPALELDLAGFVAKVASSSRTLRLARLDVSSAQTDKMSALAGALPRVGASASYGRELLAIDPRESQVPFHNQFQAGATVSQNLFNMSVFYAVRASGYFDDMSREQLEAARQSVINGARKAFYGALLAKEVRDVSLESEAAAQENYDNVRLRYQNGAASEFDLLQAEAAHLATIPARIRAQRDYEVALNALKTLAGIGIDEDLELKGSLDAPPQQTQPAGGAGAAALERRPDLRARELQRQLLDINVSAARSQHYPTLAASLSYATTALSDGAPQDVNNDSLTLGLQLSVPVFTGGAVDAAVRKAQIDRDKAETRVEELSDQIRADVKNAELKLQEAARAVDASARSVQSAERAYEITQTRVANGAATQLELTSSRIARDQAKVGYYSAVYDLLAARFDWEQATGQVP